MIDRKTIKRLFEDGLLTAEEMEKLLRLLRGEPSPHAEPSHA